MQTILWHDTDNWSSLIWSKSTDVIGSDIHFIILLWDFLWEDPREAKYQVWWLWLILMSNKLIPRRKTCYESEAEPGGSLSLVPTIRSNHSMPEELEKPVGKEWVIVSCLIKVAVLCLSVWLSLSDKIVLLFKAMVFTLKRQLVPMWWWWLWPSIRSSLFESVMWHARLTKPLLGAVCASESHIDPHASLGLYNEIKSTNSGRTGWQVNEGGQASLTKTFYLMTTTSKKCEAKRIAQKSPSKCL